MKFPKWNPPQKLAWQAVEKASRLTLTLAWGRGVGKSWFLRQFAWIQVAKNDGQLRIDALEPFRGVRIIFLTPTLQQFKDVHAAQIESELGGKWASLGGKIDHTSWRITFPGGSWIMPMPAAEYTAQRGRGLRADIVLSDEADDIDVSTYDAVCSPWLSEPWSFGLEVFSGTPRRGRHGLLFRNFENGRKGAELRSGLTIADQTNEQLKKFWSFRATYRDAPGNVSAEAVAQARQLTSLTTFKREWEADFDSGEGLVFPFDASFHVRTPPPKGEFAFHVVGVDFGWVDAGVFLWIGVRGHGNDAEAWILGEYYESEVPTHVWDERARAWNFAQTFFCDPSRPQDIQRLKGFCNAVKADNSLEGGLDRVASLLSKRQGANGKETARLFVSPKCTNTIREFGLYRRKRDPYDPDGFLEKPEDKHNHSMDALRYAVVGVFGRGNNTRSVVSGR